MFLRRSVPWPHVDIHGKFYGDRPRGTPTAGGLNARAYSNIAIFDLSKAISRKRCKIGGELVLITNRKLHMSFRLVPKLVTLNDVERRNGHYFALFQRIL